MSDPFLMRACINAILSDVGGVPGIDEDNCDYQLNGQPPPRWGGNEYIAIHGAGWQQGQSNNQQSYGLDEVYSMVVTLTRRLTGTPNFQLENDVVLNTDRRNPGMFMRLRQIVACLMQQRFAIMQAANVEIAQGAFLPGDVIDGIIEPFYWTHCDPEPEFVGAGWFSGTQPPPPESNNYGLILRAYFSNARRVSDIDNLGER